METAQHYFNDQPVQIIGRENSREVWVETTTGAIRRVFEAGLSTGMRGTVAFNNLRIDHSRGTDGAR